MAHRSMSTRLEHLHLLVLAHAELRGFLPMRAVLPTMLDETTRMAIFLIEIRHQRMPPWDMGSARVG
jgi:hypothetical protein